MNEKIKELAKQSGTASVIDGMDGRFYVISPAMEKFAELIIRECANIVSNKITLETNEDYREGFHRAKQFIWQDINKHFGVGEPATEMTVTEIEKLLGKKIKIVK